MILPACAMPGWRSWAALEALTRAMLRWVLVAALWLPCSGAAQTLDDAQFAFANSDFERAAELAEPLAAAGQVEALALLGLIARDRPVPDVGEARALLTSAAASGSVTAMVALGRAHEMGELGLRPDPVTALSYYEQAIAAGSAVAEVNLIGLISRGALGVPDWSALHTRLAELVDDGVPGARVMLAESFATGRGGSVDPQAAWDVLRPAVVHGEGAATRLRAWMLIQGVGGDPDRAEGRALLEQAARAGHGPAATDLGLLHLTGAWRAPVDTREAAEWFETAVRFGDGWAALHLARLLSDGRGEVPDDPARAIDLLRFADGLGIGPATHALALAYWDGEGVDVDLRRARELMDRAAAYRIPRALNDLGVMTETGIWGDPNPDAARDLYEAAARGGDAIGAWNLADLLLNTEVPPSDPVEGYAWCLWAQLAAPDQAARESYSEGCARHAEFLTADVIQAAERRFADLP